MNWRRNSIPLAILVLVHHVRTDVPPIVNHFAKDWTIGANHSVVYSRSFNRRHEFGFMDCDNVKKLCDVNVIRAEESDYHERTCGLRQDLISGKTGKLALYLPDSKDRDSEQFVQAWWLKRNDKSETRITSLKLKSCLTDRFAFIPVSGDPSLSRIIPYNYPNFELIYDDPNNQKSVKFVSFSPGESGLAWKLGTKYTYMFGEEGVIKDSSRGFFYLGTNGDPDWNLSVNYANTSSQQVRELGVLEHLRDPPKTSGAHNKYGLCWKVGTRKITCTQFDINGQRTVNEVSFDAPEDVYWLAVHNLEEAAILVSTGTCNNGKCNEFNVRKINANGETGSSFKIDNLNVETPKSPSDLSLNVVEDPEKNTICFNFVSLQKKDENQPNEKTILQYRRDCFAKSDFESMIK